MGIFQVKNTNRQSKLKNKLQILIENKKLIYLLYIMALVLIAGLLCIYLHRKFNIKIQFYFFEAITAIVVIIGIMTFPILFDTRRLSLESKLLEYESETLQKKVEEDIFENSIKMSYKYLDQYYLQTRKHSQNGFFITVCVAVFGALLIFAGVIAMFLGEVKPSYVTCASGAITELIAAIFFYLYNKTVSRMSKYHNKLVLSHNVSIALKVAESLPDGDKAEAKSLIVNELLKDINTHFSKDELDK